MPTFNGFPVPVASTSSGGVSAVSNSDGTLTISPTSGAVVASLNLGHANTWTAAQIVSDSGGTYVPLTVEGARYPSINIQEWYTGGVLKAYMFADGGNNTSINFGTFSIFCTTDIFGSDKLGGFNVGGASLMAFEGNYQIAALGPQLPVLTSPLTNFVVGPYSGSPSVIPLGILAANSQTAPMLAMLGRSSTSTVRNLADYDANWDNSTDSTRTAHFVLRAYDYNGSREIIRGGANGSAGTLGFYGTAPVAQPTGDPVAAAATLGLVSSPQYGSGTLTTDTDGSTITFSVSQSNRHTVVLGGNRTLALSGATTGQVFLIRLVQDSTGSRTVTWFSTIRWAGGSAPTLTTTANKADTFVFLCTGSGTYDGYIAGQGL